MILISHRTKAERLHIMKKLLLVNFLRFLIISRLILNIQGNFTKISRSNVLLSRRKRYLLFPMGSNLVMTISAVKALLQIQPRGYNFLMEVDVPFALPSDTRLFAKKKKHRMERRGVYSQLDTALTETGLNGTDCVKRIICDAQHFIPYKGKSLVKDLLMAIFTSPESDFDEDYGGNCEMNGWPECEIPLLDYILKSFESQENYENT